MMVHSTKNNLTLLVAACLAIMLYSGCQTPPTRAITVKDLDIRQPDYVRSYKNDLKEMSIKSLSRIQSEYTNVRNNGGNNPQSYDLLMLSGGGAFGAFGAGFLYGWGEVKDEEFKRPIFDTVSGISTGALIAPFAFLGTENSYRKIIELYENPEDNLARERGIIPYLPGNVSLYDVSKLHKRVRSVINSDLIHEIANNASKNRQLLIGATNLDYGLMRVWDLIKIVGENPVDEAAEQISSILLASSAIPGAFPPISIDELLYVDGGATMQVVSGIEERSWLYQQNKNSLKFFDGNRPIRIRIWMIINQKLLPDHRVVRSRWTSIAGRSLNVLLRASTLQTIQDTETFIRMMDQLPEFDAKMHYVAIPQDYQIDDSDNMFSAEIMRKLTALGRKMGTDSTSWKTEALRPGAPF